MCWCVLGAATVGVCGIENSTQTKDPGTVAVCERPRRLPPSHHGCPRGNGFNSCHTRCLDHDSGFSPQGLRATAAVLTGLPNPHSMPSRIPKTQLPLLLWPTLLYGPASTFDIIRETRILDPASLSTPQRQRPREKERHKNAHGTCHAAHLCQAQAQQPELLVGGGLEVEVGQQGQHPRQLPPRGG